MRCIQHWYVSYYYHTQIRQVNLIKRRLGDICKVSIMQTNEPLTVQMRKLYLDCKYKL